MGRVHLALSRRRTDESDIDCELWSDRSTQQSSAPDRFQFMQYALAARPLAEIQQFRKQGLAGSPARNPALEPAREFTLDLNRIDPHLSAFHYFDARASEQYKKLALTLISKAPEQKLKRLLIASAKEGDGRTSVTLNLACSLARARRRVLVVDADLRRPSVLRLLGLRCELGLTEALGTGMSPGSALVRVLPHGFNVLSNERLENSAGLLAAPGFWRILELFDPYYDFILFDSPPLLDSGDPSLLTRLTDTTLLVVGSGSTRSAEMARAVAPFSPQDIFGVVVNKMRE